MNKDTNARLSIEEYASTFILQLYDAIHRMSPDYDGITKV